MRQPTSTFCKNPQVYDGATLVKDLCDVPGLDLDAINKKSLLEELKKPKEEALLKIKYTKLVDRCLDLENFSIILLSFMKYLKRINNLK